MITFPTTSKNPQGFSTERRKVMKAFLFISIAGVVIAGLGFGFTGLNCLPIVYTGGALFGVGFIGAVAVKGIREDLDEKEKDSIPFRKPEKEKEPYNRGGGKYTDCEQYVRALFPNN